MIHNSDIARIYVLFIYLFMLYVAGFEEKNAPQLYVNADSFEKAYTRAEEWALSKRYELISLNDFCADLKIEVNSTCYSMHTSIDPNTHKPINKLIPKDSLAIFGIRYMSIDELGLKSEIERLYIAEDMKSIIFNSEYDIRGSWRVTSKTDIVLI